MKINKAILGATIIGIGSMVSSVAFGAQGYTPLPLESGLSEKTAPAVLDLDAKLKTSKDGTSADVNMNTEVKKSDTDKEDVDTEVKTNKDAKDTNDVEIKEHSSMGDAHRSAVASFVQKLLTVSDHEKGIGAEVKAIAQAQDNSQKVTADALVKVEKRSGLKTFFIGTDYKNIGVLRSSMVTTANQIDALKKLADKATSTSDKVTLQAQIQVLEQEQVKIDAFVKANEGKFSLFGWLFK